MTRYIAQVNLQRVNALPEDVVVNTWHFEGDDDLQAGGHWADNAPGVATRLETFYTTIAPHLGHVLSGIVNVKLYNWRDAKPRVPGYEHTFNIASALGSSLPAEVALCLSFRGSTGAGKNMARRRGRVYLGPLSTGMSTVPSGSPDARPVAANRQVILNAAEAMAHGSGSGTARLAVYSPTQGLIPGQDDEAWNDVVELWIDDAFDTQRRRGAKATSRLSISVG